MRAVAGRIGRELETRISGSLLSAVRDSHSRSARARSAETASLGAGVPTTQDGPRPARVTPATSEERDPALAGLRAARLVVAESPETAVAAVRSGVPRAAVWLLAIPPERAAPGEPVPWAGPIREVVPQIGGLIADSLDAAGILERVAGPVRTVVFPPLTTDRTCATCGRRQSGADDSASAEAHDIFPTDVPGHLHLWRRLIDEAAAGKPRPTVYSYAVARLRGPSGPWVTSDASWRPAPLARGAVPQPDALSGGESQETVGAGEWTAEAQRRGARQLLASLPPDGASAVASAGQGERGAANGRLRLRIIGHDLRFMHELAGVLDERSDIDVVVDEWRNAGVKNEGITENLVRTGQTLVADWAGPHAVWLSEVKRPDQRLVVRLHRLELDTQYPAGIDIDAVDAVVYIAPHVGRRILVELGWPADKLVYVPNYIDFARLDRPKFPDSRFTLGMVGMAPALKRFDLALDLLHAVRREDPRFTLVVRGQWGWSHKATWQNADERRVAQHNFERVEKDPYLRGAVVFEAFGRDMAAWYRKIGHILSLSDVEGSHVALCEGMGSGAVPVVRGWPGAAELYGEDVVCGSLDEAVSRVLACADADVWAERSAAAKRLVTARFDAQQVVEAWVDLAFGRIQEARARFAPHVPDDQAAKRCAP